MAKRGIFCLWVPGWEGKYTDRPGQHAPMCTSWVGMTVEGEMFLPVGRLMVCMACVMGEDGEDHDASVFYLVVSSATGSKYCRWICHDLGRTCSFLDFQVAGEYHSRIYSVDPCANSVCRLLLPAFCVAGTSQAPLSRGRRSLPTS